MAPVEKPSRIDPAHVQQEQEEGHEHYPYLSYGEFADCLFGDEEAEPSDDFILAFARAAVEVSCAGACSLHIIEILRIEIDGRNFPTGFFTLLPFREWLRTSGAARGISVT